MPPNTQTDSRTVARLLRSPLLLALVVTLANAVKPVLIDDTAYLAYARHIATNPLDPYGFTIFWYTVPDQAFEVLAPPVVPYWLAVGVRLFGEHPATLKLWLFPFAWLVAWAIRELLRRFAKGTEWLLPLIVLSPAILPAVNLMLDVPAVALGLAAVAVFARAADRGSWRLVVASGLLAALAMQTKYTMLVIPPVLAWYGLTHGRVSRAAVAVGVAILAFAAWELFLVQKYGRSHFAYHAMSQQADGGIAEFVQQKFDLCGPLAGHIGCLGAGVGLVAVGALGVGRRWLLLAAGVWALGFALVAVVPYRHTLLAPDTSAVSVYWQCAGTAVLVALAGCAAVLTFRVRKGLGLRLNADAAFLVGWLLIEVAGYFVLTPFPAARRVIGVTVVGGLLAARVVSRRARWRAGRRPGAWVVAFGVATGATVAAIDTLDAFPERTCAEYAAAVTANRPAGSRVWFAGHWGFQYYCERAGMRPIVPGQSVLAPGDWLVLPVHPDDDGFHRPHFGSVAIRPPSGKVEKVAETLADDWLSARTVPNYYGGIDPVSGRDHPRLRVVVYRLKSEWAVGSR